MLDRRANMELALKRSLIVARRAKIAQFEKDVGEHMSCEQLPRCSRFPTASLIFDPDVVVEVFSRHAINVTDAAGELGVASADLRRLLWANPKLTDAAVEIEERRLDLAERNIYEALRSDDPRRRDAASMFTIRNSHRARKRGWITTSTSVAELSITASALVRARSHFVGGPTTDDKRDAEAAEAERLRDAGASSSNTRPAQSLRTRIKILATA